MTLKFTNKTIQGTTLSIMYRSPEPKLKRFNLWGLAGDCEIFANALGGRDIVVSHILHGGFSKFADLAKARNNLDAASGSNGKLEFSTGSGNTLQELTFGDVTFDRYEEVPLSGQANPGALKDIAGTLFDDSGNADGGWFIQLNLFFRQLVF